MASRTLIGARLLRRMVHFIDIDIAEPELPRSRSRCVSDVPAMRAVRIEQLMAPADFSLRWSRDPRRPFRRKARSPRVRTSAFAARLSDLRRGALVTRASWSVARSSCPAPPSIQFLFVAPELRSPLPSRRPHGTTLFGSLRFARCERLGIAD
jgi:hypothetical protein